MYALMPAQQIKDDVQSRDMNAAAYNRNDESTEEEGINSLTSIRFMITSAHSVNESVHHIEIPDFCDII